MTDKNKEKKNDKKDDVYDILKEKEKFYEEENISPEVRAVLDDVFSEMVSDGTTKIATTIELSPNIEEIKELKTDELKKGLSPEHGNKLKELEAKFEDYNKKIQKLDEKIIQYDKSRKDYEEKTKLLEESKAEFEGRSKKLDESRKEFEERLKKLEEARETFMQLSKQIEKKRIDLEKRESHVLKMQKIVNKKELKIEEKAKKLGKEIVRHKKTSTKMDLDSKELSLTNYVDHQKNKGEEWESLKVNEMEKGKVDILRDILQELLFQGNFKSCFLIDGNGMIISEYSKTELNALAIGAMFSLVTTTVLRTIKNLSLNELEYFKLSSINGKFLLRNIDIDNYDKNFILLAYYDENNLDIPNKKRKELDKNEIKKILKILKKDFYEFGKGQNISWIFDNLIERIDFLKQKYTSVDGDIELIRLNLMNKTSIKIIELFEM
ncbi:MAG: hypothetical protein ACFFAN_07685 [Promethearchaeota archaeon]